MKTTVDISDSLLRGARPLEGGEKVTIEPRVEHRAHHVVSKPKPVSAFKLRKASVKGEGLHPDLREASWDRIRDLIYDESGN